MGITKALQSDLLKEWLNPSFLDEQTINKLKTDFKENKPFEHLEIKHFLKEDKINELIEALANEEFIQKESDLFKLKQTNDLKSSSNKTIEAFRSFLISEPFITFMEHLTDLKIKPNTVDLAGTLYEYTDYLLCHDDQLEGRSIAFLLYLTDLEEREGGTLSLLESNFETPTKVTRRITPKTNTFAFFKVTNRSFHEVEEVIVKKQRVAFGGWFHGR
jgi:prolyl 3-hydroxylase /prolyl 3,4-dihydroxylase